jgi:hypothetical protein
MYRTGCALKLDCGGQSLPELPELPTQQALPPLPFGFWGRQLDAAQEITGVGEVGGVTNMGVARLIGSAFLLSGLEHPCPHILAHYGAFSHAKASSSSTPSRNIPALRICHVTCDCRGVVVNGHQLSERDILVEMRHSTQQRRHLDGETHVVTLMRLWQPAIHSSFATVCNRNSLTPSSVLTGHSISP